MYAAGMLGTRKLRPAIEKGTDAVRKADASLKICVGLMAVTLVIAVCTLAAVLATRPARA